MILKDCPEGFQGQIKLLKGPSVLKKRFFALGFVPGRKLKVIRQAPLKDPLEVEIMGYLLAIRKEEAQYVVLET